MSYIAINGYELPPPKRGVHPIVTTVVDAAETPTARWSVSEWVETSTRLTVSNGLGSPLNNGDGFLTH